jgi:hypothetical protein
MGLTLGFLAPQLTAVVLFIMTVSGELYAQPEVPKTFRWNTQEDYLREEKKVEDVLKWLCRTPWGAEASLRADGNVYVLAWLTGTPTLTLDVRTAWLPEVVSSEEELFYSFLHGALLYSMQCREPIPAEMYRRGLETVAFLALQSERYSGDRRLRPLLKAYRKNRLDESVKEWMAAPVGS